MLLSARTMRILFEAAEQAGFALEPILTALELDRQGLTRDGSAVSWATFTRVADELALSVHGDVERIRAIGRVMNRLPSSPLRAAARSVISVRRLYEIAARWVAPSTFPHLRLFVDLGPNDRILIHGLIPNAYEPCEAFLQISVGTMVSTSILLGLPPAEIIDVRVDGRTLDLELQLPAQRSLLSSGLRALTAFVRRADQASALEERRKELSEGLSASHRACDELRDVLDNLPDPVVVHVEARILFVNQAFVRVLGWASAEELVGGSLIDLVDPRSRGLFQLRLTLPPEARGKLDLTEAWMLTRDGRSLLIEVNPSQTVTFNGLAARLVVGRDLAERSRLEQRLAAADRLASLGLLAAGVAHEVNNPLAYLLNNIEIAKKQLTHFGPDADVARNALDIALEGVDRIRFIVRELLLLARMETTPLTSTDLGGAVESTLALARIEIGRTARLVLNIQPVAPVRGSVPRIAQIVLNLVLNALEAMRSREVGRNELTVRVTHAGDAHALLEVSDTGIGVDPADEPRLFDPFFSTKPEGSGTGLGLAITQRLVAELGGEISFTSTLGRGTTFRVLFAIHDEDRVRHASDESRAAHPD